MENSNFIHTLPKNAKVADYTFTASHTSTKDVLDVVYRHDLKGFINWLVNKWAEEEFLTTYKFYTKEGERLAVFGTPDADGNLGYIHYLKCSKSDQFNKKFARTEFKKYLYGNSECKWRTVPVNNMKYNFKDFLRTCRSMFYVKDFALQAVPIFVKNK